MPRFMAALMILSLFAIAQGRVVISPAPSSALEAESPVAVIEDLPRSGLRSASIGGLPEPISIVCLLVGLTGLAAAGSRPNRDAGLAPVKRRDPSSRRT